MKNRIDCIRRSLDNSLLCVCGVALFVLVIAVTWQVFSRYILNDPSSFTDELARYTMIWLGLIGASYLFGKNGHLAITLLPESLPRQYKHYLLTLIHLLSFTFVSLTMIKGGLALISRTWHQFSPSLQIPMAYVYAILPIAGSLMAIYIILNVVEMFCSDQNNDLT